MLSLSTILHLYLSCALLVFSLPPQPLFLYLFLSLPRKLFLRGFVLSFLQIPCCTFFQYVFSLSIYLSRELIFFSEYPLTHSLSSSPLRFLSSAFSHSSRSISSPSLFPVPFACLIQSTSHLLVLHSSSLSHHFRTLLLSLSSAASDYAFFQFLDLSRASIFSLFISLSLSLSLSLSASCNLASLY